MKRILVTFSLCIIMCSSALCQESGMDPYKLSLGARMGFSSGIAAKYFLNEKIALEGIAGLRYFRGAVFTGLVEAHYPIAVENETLYFYIGGGGHAGYYFWYNNSGKWNKGNGWGAFKGTPSSIFFVGIDVIGGLEYKFKEYPFTISVDVKPFVSFIGYIPGFYDGALTVRYIFE